jgi:hypothetical protein
MMRTCSLPSTACRPRSRACGFVAIALAVVTLGVAGQPAPPPEVDLGGRLYQSVFLGADLASELAALDRASLPPAVRARLSTAAARAKAHRVRIAVPANAPWEVSVGTAYRQHLERAAVALIDAPGIETEAAAAFTAATLFYESEGRPDVPLDEAAWAESYIKTHRESALTSFLYVFAMHRLRHAFELQAQAKDIAAQAVTAKKYRAFLQRARASADPVFVWLTEDLDRLPHVALETPTHPRDFNPDT